MKIKILMTAVLSVALPIVCAAPPSSMKRVKTVPSARVEPFEHKLARSIGECAKQLAYAEKKKEAAALVHSVVMEKKRASHPHSVLRRLVGVAVMHEPDNEMSAYSSVNYDGNDTQALIQINTARFPTADSMEESLAHEAVHIENVHGLYTEATRQIPELDNSELRTCMHRCDEIEADTFSLFDCTKDSCAFVARRYKGALDFLDAHEKFEKASVDKIKQLTRSEAAHASDKDRAHIESAAQSVIGKLTDGGNHPSGVIRRAHIRDVYALAQDHNGIVPKRALQRLVAQHSECGEAVVTVVRGLEKILKNSIVAHNVQMDIPTRFPE